MLPLLFAMLQLPSFGTAQSNSNHDDAMVHCPSTENATSSCDAPTFFTYHICCDAENMFCCMRLQVYIIIAIVVISILLLTALITFSVHWTCRIKRKRHQSYNFT
ncbi:hypothetical protein KIN20_038444 [Parelaphostrongylus tenuis]|uniref:Uncharacterized protein n=1 Tax=Parelaphostrongylus tenuis TaxID=148309 RepID=A0AAD5R1I4_PARTN|nr:hypothetical protein KIN20_038444 [Parelaphostrongylus tenuis]